MADQNINWADKSWADLGLYGTGVPAAYLYKSDGPLDAKAVIEKYEYLAGLVAKNIAYEGMIVFVKDKQKHYTYINSSWTELDTKVAVDTTLSDTSTNPVQNNVINSALDAKVDKETGKGLSTNDFETKYKDTLDNMAWYAAPYPYNTEPLVEVNSSNYEYNSAEGLYIAAINLEAGSAFVDIPLLVMYNGEKYIYKTKRFPIPEPLDTIYVGNISLVATLFETDLGEDSGESFVVLYAEGAEDTAGQVTVIAKEAADITVTILPESLPEEYLPTDTVLDSTSCRPVQNRVINSALNTKVDKVEGMGLSTNDFTEDYKTKLDNALTSFTEIDPTVPQHVKSISEDDITAWNNKSNFSGSYTDLSDTPTLGSLASKSSITETDFDTTLAAEFNNKVSKDGNKVLSTNDFEDKYKNTLDDVAWYASKAGTSTLIATIFPSGEHTTALSQPLNIGDTIAIVDNHLEDEIYTITIDEDIYSGDGSAFYCYYDELYYLVQNGTAISVYQVDGGRGPSSQVDIYKIETEVIPEKYLPNTLVAKEELNNALSNLPTKSEVIDITGVKKQTINRESTVNMLGLQVGDYVKEITLSQEAQRSLEILRSNMTDMDSIRNSNGANLVIRFDNDCALEGYYFSNPHEDYHGSLTDGDGRATFPVEGYVTEIQLNGHDLQDILVSAQLWKPIEIVDPESQGGYELVDQCDITCADCLFNVVVPENIVTTDGDLYIGTADSENKVATEKYVDNKVADFVESAPDTLNTLNELAAALGNDSNFATTVATNIGNKVDKETGKGLSTNDFEDKYKDTLDDMGWYAEKDEEVIATLDPSKPGAYSLNNQVALGDIIRFYGDYSVDLSSPDIEITSYDQQLWSFYDEAYYLKSPSHIEVTSSNGGHNSKVIVTKKISVTKLPEKYLQLPQEIDFLTQAITVDGGLDVTITAPHCVDINTEEVDINGNVTISGPQEYINYSPSEVEVGTKVSKIDFTKFIEHYDNRMGDPSVRDLDISLIGTFNIEFSDGSRCRFIATEDFDDDGSMFDRTGILFEQSGNEVLFIDLENVTPQGYYNNHQLIYDIDGEVTSVNGFNNAITFIAYYEEYNETYPIGECIQVGRIEITSGILHAQDIYISDKKVATKEYVDNNSIKNIRDTDNSSIAQINAVAAGENSSAFGMNVAEKNDDGSYDLTLSITKGYNNTEWYNTDGTGSGATEDLVPIEPLTEPEYYKDGTTEITSVHDITFTTTGAHGVNAYSEGNNTLALGNYTHTEGYKTYAAASGSHAEGSMNVVFGVDSHSEGARNISIAQASHTEGMRNTALGKGSHIEGFKNQTGRKSTWSHIEGEGNLINGMASHGEGGGNVIYDDLETITNEDGSVTEKNHIAYSHVEGYNNKVKSAKAHAEGEANLVTADAAHVEGKNNKATGKYSHAEGFKTAAIGQSAHSEGASSNIVPETVINADTAIEAFGTSKFIAALGLGSHAEGYNTLSLGSGTHSEGKETIAKGETAHAEGYRTEANAKQSHAEGIGTIANGNFVHVQGQYNIPAASGYADIVGNGTVDARSNAYTLKWTGDGHYAGNVYANATWDSETGTTTGGEKLTTASEVAKAVSDGLNSLTVENGSGVNSIQTAATTASGKDSVAVGTRSSANTLGTFVTGYYTQSKGSNYQSVRGRANLITASGSSGLFAEVVGGGKADDQGATRANAYTLDWNGNAHFAGDVYAGATWAENSKGTNIVATTVAENKLAKEGFVKNYVDERLTKDTDGIKIDNNTTIVGTLTIGNTTLTETQLIKILNFIDSIEG